MPRVVSQGEAGGIRLAGMGQITDDTQLSVALIRSLVSKGGEFNHVDFAERLLTLLRNSAFWALEKQLSPS